MPLPRRTTDYGTVLVHLVLVLTSLELIASGLRIGADDPQASWLQILDPVLPREHLWWRHLVAGLGLTMALGAYVAYIRAARLTARVRVDRARIASLLNGGRARFGALNVAVFWAMMGALVTEVITGVLLFGNWGGLVLTLHLAATFVFMSAIGLHVTLHALHGGLGQLLRIFRPGPLDIPEAEPDFAEILAQHLAREQKVALPAPKAGDGVKLSAHPAASALAVAGVIGVMFVGAEEASRPVLEISEITAAEAPVLDGELSDPVWARATPARVLTTHGGDFGGSHESQVEIRAVHDGVLAYFAITWDDPTRSLKHKPLVKTAAGWRVVAASRGTGEEAVYAEDKFALLLTRPGLPLIGGAIHLGHRPARGKPDGVTGRGLHFTPDGSIADLIEWRASHGGPQGLIENAHFGGPLPASDDAQGYTGGFAPDPGSVGARDNIVTAADGSVVHPARLPRDPAQMQRALGRIVDAPGQSDAEGSRWWMSEEESLPYSPALDASIPEGTIIPSVIVPSTVPDTASAIRGQARWAAGRWTLEFARRLYTGSPWDVPIRDGTLLWVAAFDHAEKRHTRHLRPFRIEVK